MLVFEFVLGFGANQFFAVPSKENFAITEEYTLVAEQVAFVVGIKGIVNNLFQIGFEGSGFEFAVFKDVGVERETVFTVAVPKEIG